MKIYLLDISRKITTAWQQYFANILDITIVTSDFELFMNNNNVECVVSPGNSKGVMSGGYDLAITLYYGPEITINVQKYIKQHYYGLQPVGSAFIIDIPNSNQKLIHCPTMVGPSLISDLSIIDKCMYNVLTVAKKNNINSIVIPAFGGATGGVSSGDVAKHMFNGYKKFLAILK